MRAAMSSLMRRLHAPVYDARQRALLRLIVPLLEPGDDVLDVGCGVGTLGAAIMADPGAPEGVSVTGLERAARGDEPIPVRAYDGARFPDEDRSHDVVIVADVLHHEEDPDRLLAECARVARRLVVVKDHQRAGLLAQPRISLIDWAANAPYGVPCLFRYNTPAQWREVPGRLGMRAAHEISSIDLYPPVVNALFGRRLQYMLVLAHDEPPAGRDSDEDA